MNHQRKTFAYSCPKQKKNQSQIAPPLFTSHTAGYISVYSSYGQKFLKMQIDGPRPTSESPEEVTVDAQVLPETTATYPNPDTPNIASDDTSRALTSCAFISGRLSSPCLI